MRLCFRILGQVKMASAAYNKVCSYTPPAWCAQLKGCPTSRVNLAMVPTPIHAWNIPGLPSEFTLHIKRDDMTGCVLGGNKVRKLEFLLADALNKGCGSVITCGALQSNHCRATAAAAAQLGLKTHLLLRSKEDISDIGSTGNLFLSRMCGADIYLVPKRAQYEVELKSRQSALAELILKKTGKPAYPIGIGGSNHIGLHGYLRAWEELLQQGVADKFDDIALACGSGGSAAGLAIGNYLTGSKVKIHAIAVCDDAKYFHGHINSMLSEVGIDSVRSEDIIDVIEGYKGSGYGESTKEDRDLYREIASTTGIYCDPVYSGKGIKGTLAEMNKNPQRFQGKRVLFIHTGGVFGLYDGKMDDVFSNTSCLNVFDWKDSKTDPATFFENQSPVKE